MKLDKNKLEQFLKSTTKNELKRKTPHDKQVDNLNNSYDEICDKFTEKHKDLIEKLIFGKNKKLKEFFRNS